ncbi:MAG: hypothetical protein EOM59_18370 [Clostridia bacterium]|nr:hypothetical protein [Clostridia bacterium]
MWELLDEVGLDYLNHLEWLIRTDKTYTGDHFIVEAYHAPKTLYDLASVNYGDRFVLSAIEEISTDNFKLLKFLHDIIISGATLITDDFSIDDLNRKVMYKLTHALYKNEIVKRRKMQQVGINKAKEDKKYLGRKKIHVSVPLLEEIILKRERGTITIEEAMKALGIASRSTFYRRVKEFKEVHPR